MEFTVSAVLSILDDRKWWLDAKMGPKPIREDKSPEALRILANREPVGRVRARLLAIAAALEGMERAEAGRFAGMSGKTLRYWVDRYNEEGTEGLRDRPRQGRPRRMTPE